MPDFRKAVLHGDQNELGQLLPHQRFEIIAKSDPFRTALHFLNDSLSYGELNSRADSLAAILVENGAEPGVVCAISIRPHSDFVVAVLAIYKVGAIYLPLDPDSPIERMHYILSDAKPKLLISRNAKFEGLEELCGKIIELDGLNLNSNLGATEADGQFLAAVNHPKANIANIIYTSGTTGNPKGVLTTYSGLRHYINVAVQQFRMSEGIHMLAVAKFTFSISHFEVLAPLASGGSVRILPRETVLAPAEMLRAVQQCTMVHMGPALWLRVLDEIQNREFPIQSLAHVMHASTGGDLVPPELLSKLVSVFPSAEVYVLYGCTEIACMGTNNIVEHGKFVKKTYVGVPFSNTSVAVVHPITNIPVPVGEKGEICFSGDGVAIGYLGQQKQFDQKIIKIEGGNYYKTGDVGRVSSDGKLEMLGREDFQVKISGVRIELAEIDYWLRKAPHMSGAQVVTMFWHEKNNIAKIYAYLTKKLNANEISDVRKYLGAHLIEQMLPKKFLFVESLPLNINLKVDRKSLPRPEDSLWLRESEYGKPETKTQLQLLQVWKVVLGVNSIGVDDDFFHSGGTSILSVYLLQKIDVELGINLDLNVLMANRTVRRLAEFVDMNGVSPAQVIPIRRTSSRDALIFIHDGNGDVMPYYSISREIDVDHNVFAVPSNVSKNVPMPEVDFGELIDVYVDKIINLNVEGRISLGGLCIGGYLAYCVAAKLQLQGRKVESVFLYDSHYIDAAPSKDHGALFNKKRKENLVAALSGSRARKLDALALPIVFLKKGYRFLSYETASRCMSFGKKLQIFLLRAAKKYPWLMSQRLPFPSVDTVLRYSEKNYTERPSFDGDVYLYLATKKLSTLDYLKIDDTPYREIFGSDGLGWSDFHRRSLTIIPIAAGHSTLLTPPYSQKVAASMTKVISGLNRPESVSVHAVPA